MNNDYSPYGDYEEIIHPDFRHTINRGTGTHLTNNSLPDDDISENGAVVIVCLFASLLLLAVFLIVIFIIH